MRKTSLCLALLGTLAAVPALAQSAPNNASGATTANPRTESAPPAATPPAATQDSGIRTTATPTAGANSFTESQARNRIEAAGFSNIDALQKDDQGIWRGRAMRNGQQVSVSLDYQGSVSTR